MTAQATDWLSLDQAKVELNLTYVLETAQQAQLLGYISSAIKTLENESGLPLIDRSTIVSVGFRQFDFPLLTLDRLVYPRSIQAVNYWSAGRDPEQYPIPDQTIADLSKIRLVSAVPNDQVGQFYVMNDESWPSGVQHYQISVLEGLLVHEHPELEQAVKLLVSEFGFGRRIDRPDALWRSLIPIVVQGSVARHSH